MSLYDFLDLLDKDPFDPDLIALFLGEQSKQEEAAE